MNLKYIEFYFFLLLKKKYNFIYLFFFVLKIDGVLFYHKEGHYHQGYATPLSLWLKAYMIPDILKIPLPSWITQTAPSDYINNKFYEE
jgi:hypothetical protein